MCLCACVSIETGECISVEKCVYRYLVLSVDEEIWLRLCVKRLGCLYGGRARVVLTELKVCVLRERWEEWREIQGRE